MDELSDSFSACFNGQKIKYMQYDMSITNAGYLNPNDKVNLFINLESVFKYLSVIKDVEKKIFNCADFHEIMVSNIINLAAHYRRFFRGNNLDVKIYLYMTDFNSDIGEFNESEINSDFRSYYLIKYLKNPKYSIMGEKLRDIIIPTCQEICQFINGVYVISTLDIESSVLPLLIANKDPLRKNLLVTSEFIDLQYSYYNNFMVHYVKRSPGPNGITYLSDLDSYLRTLIKKPSDDYSQELFAYSNRSFYILLLAVTGEVYRSLEGIKGVGNAALLKYIYDALSHNMITPNTESIALISKIFNDSSMEEVITNNFQCMDTESVLLRMNARQIHTIDTQLVDKFDNNGLLQLNSTTFYRHQLMLEELTI